jgi:hypothetical protein
MAIKSDLLASTTSVTNIQPGHHTNIQPNHLPVMVHAYDNPTLDSLQFHHAVRNDPTVPLPLRVKAAAYLAPYEPTTTQRERPWHVTSSDGHSVPSDQDCTLTIQITPLFPGQPDTHEIYSDFLSVVENYYAELGAGGLGPSSCYPARPTTDFFVDLICVMASYHTQFPNTPTRPIEFYCDLLHVQRCWELSQRTGQVVDPDLEATPPAGHA